MLKANTIKVNLAQVIGKIKPLNGGNLAPSLTEDNNNSNSEFKALNLPYTRLHDAPLENPGLRLVDISNVFPIFHLDASDPRNYTFATTDDYVKNCIDLGTEVIYRLGESVENSKRIYAGGPPPDYKQWVEICTGVIKHYTEGWGNGFHFDIKYWEIWNEPDGWCWWSGTSTLDKFNEFYAEVAIELKKRFPHLLFGGPGHLTLDSGDDFFKVCHAKNVPIDFYSFHNYGSSVEEMCEMVYRAQKLINDYGYRDTLLYLSEWHYMPGQFQLVPRRARVEFFEESLKDIDSALFLAEVLIAWQDTPLDMGGYYTVTATRFGLLRTYSRTICKNYRAMRMFGELALDRERIQAECDTPGTRLLASRNKDHATVLVTSPRSGNLNYQFKLDQKVKKIEVVALNRIQDEETVAVVENTDFIDFPVLIEPAVFLIRIDI